MSFRFPEFAQGVWSNLRIDGAAIRYMYEYSPDDLANDEGELDDQSADNGTDGATEVTAATGATGPTVRTRVRRQSKESETITLEEAMKLIGGGSPAFPTNFDIDQFMQDHNLTNFPITNLDMITVNLYKPITTEAPDETSKTRDRRSISAHDYYWGDLRNAPRFQKIMALQSLWDTQLQADIRLVHEAMKSAQKPEDGKKKLSANPLFVKVSNVLRKPVVETWHTLQSIFGFTENHDDSPIKGPNGPTPPPSPPTTPPQTPPRSASDEETSIGGFVDGQTVNNNASDGYFEYVHETKKNRRKRCFWASPMYPATTTTQGEFNEHNRDKTMDEIEKFNREHDKLHNDKLQDDNSYDNNKANGRNEIVPLLLLPPPPPPIVVPENTAMDGTTLHLPRPTPLISELRNLLSDFGYQLKRLRRSKYEEPALNSKPIAGHWMQRQRRSVNTNDRDNRRHERSGDNEREDDDDDEDIGSGDYMDDDEPHPYSESSENKVEIRTKRVSVEAQKRSTLFLAWWNSYRDSKMNEYSRMYGLDAKLKEVESENYPEMRPMPTVVEFLMEAKAIGMDYDLALILWRTLEREHRVWLSRIEYVTLQGQNDPGITLADFDHTYTDILLDFDPWNPEGTAQDPTKYRVYTLLNNGPRIWPEETRRATWERRKSQGRLEVLSNEQKYNRAFGQITPDDDDVEAEEVPPPPPFISFQFTGDGSDTSDRIKRKKRSPTVATGLQKFAWRCVQPVDDMDGGQLPLDAAGAKFLTIGGRIYDEETPPPEPMAEDTQR